MQLKFIIIICFLNFSFLWGKNNLDNAFLIGLKGGINFSNPRISKTYGIFHSLNSETVPPGKDYNTIWKNLGFQYGFTGLYRLTDDMNLLFEPTFGHYKYGYSSTLDWVDGENAESSQSSETNHVQKLRYIEIPLFFQYLYDIDPIAPYAIVGGAYGYMIGSEKFAETHNYTTVGSSRIQTSENEQLTSYNDQFIRTRLHAYAGIGARYELSSIIFMLEAGYQWSFHNISHESSRFSNQQILGSTYDINDDISLDALSLNLRVLFPLNKKSSFLKTFNCD